APQRAPEDEGRGDGRGESRGKWSRDRYGSGRRAAPAAPRGRITPPSRPDVAARLLLSNMAQWEALSQELHAILCDLPGGHGELFRWLDSQYHEHGVLSWAALREGLRESPLEALALRIMTGPDGAPVGDMAADAEQQAADAGKELSNVLDRMLIERI